MQCQTARRTTVPTLTLVDRDVRVSGLLLFVVQCFDEFGEIAGIHWVTDKATGQFYGTAFVDFTTAEAATGALVRNGVEILGRAVKVNVATGANVAGKNRFNSKQKNGGHLAQLPVVRQTRRHTLTRAEARRSTVGMGVARLHDFAILPPVLQVAAMGSAPTV